MGNRLSGLVTGDSSSSVDNSALTAAIDALSKNINSLSSDIIGSSAAMGTLTSGIDTLSNNIVSLTYGMTAINSYIIALESNTVSLSTNTESIDRLSGIIDNLQFPPGTGLNSGGFVRKFARGGVVPGQGNGDTVPAMLEPGNLLFVKKLWKLWVLVTCIR